jgi:putative lipoprotein
MESILKRLRKFYYQAIILTLLLFTLLGCAAQNKNGIQDDWDSPDKYQHFLLSTAISAATAYAAKNDSRDNCEAALIGFSVTLALGAAKESYDKRKKKTLYSGRDMVWNAAGSLTGSLLGSNCL